MSHRASPTTGNTPFPLATSLSIFHFAFQAPSPTAMIRIAPLHFIPHTSLVSTILRLKCMSHPKRLLLASGTCPRQAHVPTVENFLRFKNARTICWALMTVSWSKFYKIWWVRIRDTQWMVRKAGERAFEGNRRLGSVEKRKSYRKGCIDTVRGPSLCRPRVLIFCHNRFNLREDGGTGLAEFITKSSNFFF